MKLLSQSVLAMAVAITAAPATWAQVVQETILYEARPTVIVEQPVVPTVVRTPMRLVPATGLSLEPVTYKTGIHMPGRYDGNNASSIAAGTNSIKLWY